MSYSLNAFFALEHGDAPFVVTNADDVDDLIESLLSQQLEENSIAALYVRERAALPSGAPDHELRVALNAQGKVGGLRYTGTDGSRDGTWYVAGAVSERDEVWYCYMGNDEDYPRDSEVSIEVVRTAVKDFLSGGGNRPSSIKWNEWPSDLA